MIAPKSIVRAMVLVCIAGALVIPIDGFAQQKTLDPVRDVDVSLGKKPPTSMFFGKPVEAVTEALRGAPNSSARDSGFTLQSVLAKPVEKELVWAFNVTDTTELAFTPQGWLIGAPDKHPVRVYYHIGFDASGRAVVGAKWFHGGSPDVGGPSGLRPNPRTERPIPPPTYWNFDFVSILSQYTNLKEARVSHWTNPYDPRLGKPGIIAGRGGIQVPNPVPAARGRNGSYGPNGFVMADGSDQRGAYWAVVGQTWGIAINQPGENGNPPPFWVVEHPGQTNTKTVSVADIRLILEAAKEGYFERGKIVPTTNDAAVKQAGVK